MSHCKLSLGASGCKIRRVAKYSMPGLLLLALFAQGSLAWAHVGPSETFVAAAHNEADNDAAIDPSTASIAAPKAEAPAPASIHGVVTGKDGELFQGASVTLTLGGAGAVVSSTQSTNSEGAFSFSGLPAKPFTVTIISTGFIAQSITGTLQPGQDYDTQNIVLLLAAATADVEVTATQAEVALEQFHEELHQRVIGLVPNYFVTYVPDAPPLTRAQKYSIAWRTSVDPLSLVAAGGFAGMQQATKSMSGYGQGMQGYAKRFGANYADGFIGTLLGGAVYPSLFKQDPRYFYKGTGTTRSRILYAIANAVVCKGDNGHWQFDYSGILGSLTSGGISNLYYPASNRNGVSLTFKNTGLGIAGSSITNLLQEFLVQRFTPRIPHYAKSDQ